MSCLKPLITVAAAKWCFFYFYDSLSILLQGVVLLSSLFLLISVDSWILILFSEVVFFTLFIILMLCLSFGLRGTCEAGFCDLLTVSRHSRLPATARCSRPILYFSSPGPKSVIFPRSPGSFKWKMVFRNLRSRYVHCFWDVIVFN